MIPCTPAVLEVAGYDLELALHLADAWDGDLQRLGGLLDANSARYPELTAASEPPDVPVRGRPAASLLATWCVGACDAWEGERLRWHACAVSAQARARLERLLWRAQARTLLPVLEEQRERVVAWLARQGRARGLQEQAGDPAEIGGVWYYMRHRAGMVTRPQMPLVDWLRDARNDVAHLRCVSATRLCEGYELMESTSLSCRRGAASHHASQRVRRKPAKAQPGGLRHRDARAGRARSARECPQAGLRRDKHAVGAQRMAAQRRRVPARATRLEPSSRASGQ